MWQKKNEGAHEEERAEVQAVQPVPESDGGQPEKKRSLKPKKNLRQLKHGSYSIALTVIVVAAVVIINLIAGQLPSQYTQIDLSGQQLTVLSDTTKDMVADLTEDITIYYVLEDSNRDSNVSRLLERYADLSSHTTLVEKDPVLYPQFTSQYTDETLSDNSVILVCGDDSRVISYDDMYEYEFDYTYYSYTTSGFDAEGQITSAIAALTTEDLPKLYTLTGHGELELTDTLTSSIEKENIEIEELNLVTSDAVPDDADCLLICSPTSDLSDAEAQKIINYLRCGGSAIIITDYLTTELTNLEAVLDYYGTELVEGVVIEGNSNYYVQLPYYLVPDINSTDVSEDLSGGSAYVLLAAAQGIESAEDARDTLTISSVLTTSDDAYSKIDVENMSTYEKEDGDIDGPLDLGVLITETVELTDELLEETASVDEEADLESWLDGLVEETEEETEEAESETEEESGEAESETEEEETDTAETRVAVFTSSALVDDSANSMVSGGNYQLFVNTLSWACNQESSVSVPSKSTTLDYLTLTSASSSFWSIVTIAIIPGVILIMGLGIWLSRRKR
ncbi:MAG: Gldg family protein [Clostridiales bacterium]|nr:Gldg family protein [Clostridiales bacterium]